MLECVINISEGRDEARVASIAAAAGGELLDVHRDEHHHRSVLTLAGPDVESRARAVAAAAVAAIDIREHRGVHPRIGAVDVVPFVPLPGTGATRADAIGARDAFARWAGHELGLPCFLYGPERTLPDIRRRAFAGLTPDAGPPTPHPTAGACAVGARPILVAFNVWLAPGTDVAVARAVAAAVRSPWVRALGLDVGGRAQVSCNLIAPDRVGPAALVDAVANRAAVAGAELVGLVPAAVLEAVPPEQWEPLDLHPSKTIEARLKQAGLDGGSG